MYKSELLKAVSIATIVEIFTEIKNMLTSEGHSAGWTLLHLIYFHRDLLTPAMSTDSSQVGVTLFPSC